MAVQETLGLGQRRPDRRGDEVPARHQRRDRLRSVALEPQVAVGQDADEPTVVVGDRHAGDVVALHQLERVGDERRGRERHRVADHPRLGALDLVDLRGLVGDREVAVDDAETTLACQRDRHPRLGDGVHRRRDDRHLERDRACEARRGRDVVGQHGRRGRHEQDVVERQPLPRELVRECALRPVELELRSVHRGTVPESPRRRSLAQASAGASSVTFTPACSRPAWRGSKRPAPTSQGRRGACGHGRTQRILRRAADVSRGEEPGEERIAGPDDRHRVHPWCDGSVEPRLALLAQARDAAGLGCDQHVSRAELRDPLECEQEVLLVVEFLADERLGLSLVRRDEERLGLDPEPQRLALRVEHGRNVATRELARRLGVEVVVHVSRQRPGKDDDLRALRQVQELLVQDLELLGGNGGPPLVDLGVRAARRVDDRGRRPRLVVDAHEVVEHGLARQLLDDPRTGRTADESGRDHRHAELLQCARDIDALAAGERQACTRTVTLSALEVRDGQRPIDGCIESDGDDHGVKIWTRWWAERPAYHPSRRNALGS